MPLWPLPIWHEAAAVERLLELSPDVILIPGDIHQGPAAVRHEELPRFASCWDAGVELDYESPAAQATVEGLERSPGAGDVRIRVSHRPDTVLDLQRRTRVDLVVAGHTHGGQVQLPLLGPPIIFSRVPRSVGAGGLHDIGAGRRIYVSRGVGMERNQAPRLRLGAPPEISLLTLQDR